jgi:hypothetical protein
LTKPRSRYRFHAPLVEYLPLLLDLGTPGHIELAFNRREADAISKAQKASGDPDAVAVIQFSLEVVAEDLLGDALGPAGSPVFQDRLLLLEAWALAFDAAGALIREHVAARIGKQRGA